MEVLGSTGSKDGFGQTSKVAGPMRSGPAAASFRCAAMYLSGRSSHSCPRLICLFRYSSDD
jgi:hypothetical protein